MPYEKIGTEYALTTPHEIQTQHHVQSNRNQQKSIGRDYGDTVIISTDAKKLNEQTNYAENKKNIITSTNFQEKGINPEVADPAVKNRPSGLLEKVIDKILNLLN